MYVWVFLISVCVRVCVYKAKYQINKVLRHAIPNWTTTQPKIITNYRINNENINGGRNKPICMRNNQWRGTWNFCFGFPFLFCCFFDVVKNTFFVVLKHYLRSCSPSPVFILLLPSSPVWLPFSFSHKLFQKSGFLGTKCAECIIHSVQMCYSTCSTWTHWTASFS